MTLLAEPEAAERAGVSPAKFANRFGPYLTPHPLPDGGTGYDPTELARYLALPPVLRDPASIVRYRQSAAMLGADMVAGMRGEQTAPLYRLTGHTLETHGAEFANPVEAALWVLMAEFAITAFLGGFDTPEIRAALAKHRPALAEAARGGGCIAFAIAEGGEVVVIPGAVEAAPPRAFNVAERRGRAVITAIRNPGDIRAAITERFFA